MTSDTIAGLPLHVLLVHAVVVLAPLTAIAVVLHAFWPTAARRLGIVTPLAALVVLVLVPLTTNAGEALQKAVPHSDAVQEHAELGDTFLPWAIALLVIAVAQWLWTTSSSWSLKNRLAKRMSPRALLVIDIVLKVLAVAVAIGAIVDMVLIGDGGARAVWGHLTSG